MALINICEKSYLILIGRAVQFKCNISAISKVSPKKTGELSKRLKVIRGIAILYRILWIIKFLCKCFFMQIFLQCILVSFAKISNCTC